MVSACDGSSCVARRDPSRVIRMRGPLTFISVSAATPYQKSSEFIVHAQVSWISFPRTRRVALSLSILLSAFFRRTQKEFIRYRHSSQRLR